MSTTARPRRLKELDGLRAIAILLVLLTHFWAYPSSTPWLNRFAATGWMGVDLFFVLSGYLITGILWDSRQSPQYYRNFYARRVLRIFPLYYALLLTVFVVLPLHGSTPELAAAARYRWYYVAYLANIALAWHGWQLFTLDITWSLAIEEQFYLCWPLALRRWRWGTLWRVLIALIVCAPIARAITLASGVNWRWTLMFTPLRLDTLALGALIALAERKSPPAFDRLRRWAPAVAGTLGSVVLLLILEGAFARDSALVGSIGYSLLAMCFGALLLLSLRPPRLLGAALRFQPLRRIGAVSYGIYILHPLGYLLGATVLARVGIVVDSPFLHLIVYSVIAYAAAEVSFRVFETPLLKLKRHFEDRPTPVPSERKQPLPFEA